MVRYIPLMLCMILTFTNVPAADPVYDTQTILYYRISFGGSTPKDSAHQFGLRLDQSWIDQDRAIDMNVVMSRNAMMDFRMSSAEPARLEIHGVDYLQKYYASRADAGSSEAADTAVTEETPVEPAATETAGDQGEQTAEQAEDEPGLTDGIVDSLADVPLGIYIGLGILGAIAAGG